MIERQAWEAEFGANSFDIWDSNGNFINPYDSIGTSIVQLGDIRK